VLSERMQAELNEQLNVELYSAYTYLSMAAYFEEQNFPGFGKWLRVQAKEELGHALRCFNFIIDRGGKVLLKAIDQPPGDFSSPVEVFRQALAHEEKVTALIYRRYTAAVEENDYASQTFLHWFINEQVEEEKLLAQTLAMVERAAGDSAAMLVLDRELAGRSEESETG